MEVKASRTKHAGSRNYSEYATEFPFHFCVGIVSSWIHRMTEVLGYYHGSLFVENDGREATCTSPNNKRATQVTAEAFTGNEVRYTKTSQ